MLLRLKSGYANDACAYYETSKDNYSSTYEVIADIFDRKTEIWRGNDCFHFRSQSDFTPQLVSNNGRLATRIVGNVDMFSDQSVRKEVPGIGYQSYVLDSYSTRLIDTNNEAHPDWFRVWILSSGRLSCYRYSRNWYRGDWECALYEDRYDNFDDDHRTVEHWARNIDITAYWVPHPSFTELLDFYETRAEKNTSGWQYLGKVTYGSDMVQISSLFYYPIGSAPGLMWNIESTLYDTFGQKLLPNDVELEQAVSSAIRNTRVNHGNMLSLPKELLSTITGTEAARLARDLTSRLYKPDLKQFGRTWIPGDALIDSEATRGLISDLWLNSRFGARLTGLELEGLLENNVGSQWRKRLKAKGFGSCRYTRQVCTAIYDCLGSVSFDYEFKGFSYLIKRWDNASLPTLTDVWDVVPYSFVLDWSLGIGNRLALAEQNLYQESMDISNIWVTVRATSQGSFPSDSGILEYASRVFGRKAIPFLPTVSYEYSTGNGRNLVDLTTLYIQSKR